MIKNYRYPKVSMETAGIIRERWTEGESINSLCKRYELQRNSVKGILKGTTYNKYGEYSNLMQDKKAITLF